MDPNWAADNLKVIRTLMERSALYRRALAPVMTFAGIVGTSASVVGFLRNRESAEEFTSLWVAAGFFTIIGVVLLIRRQALRDVEPFFSLPTRRVAGAVIPPLLVGLVAAIPFLSRELAFPTLACLLVPVWFALYGCALCAAGSFMPRGIKLFGWVFVLAGSSLFVWGTFTDARLAEVLTLRRANLVMGIGFGLVHLIYGAYLYVTERKRKNAA